MYVEEGRSFRAIAQTLTDEGIPSPSAHDPARNRHRDGRGWAFSAVRAILGNPAYAGRRVWGRQEKFETLLDPSDVAAGSQTRMRWKDKEAWIRPGRVTHPSIVEDHLVAAAERLLSARIPPERTRQRPTEHPYALRGLLKCGICGSMMQGSFRKSRADGPGRVLYRCEIRRSRALPPELIEHPSTVYVRQDAIVDKIDQWISSLASAEVLAAGQLPDPSTDQQRAALGRRLSDTQHKISSLIAAIESGVEPTLLGRQLATRAVEKERILHEIGRLEPTGARSAREIQSLIDLFGSVADALKSATHDEHHRIYTACRLTCEYDPDHRTVRASISDPTGGALGVRACPRGDLNPHAP
jgi:site-specific DNA recombinase